MTSIYDAIKADHDHHRALLSKIADTTGASEARKTAWKDFYYDIKSHAAAEEESFYSKLMEQTWGQDAARHSVEEHAELDDLLEELNEMDMSSSGWLNKFHKLQHDYTHHMDEEEEDIFARARKVIDDSRAAEIGETFRSRKAKEIKLVDKKQKDKLED
ncbi:hemerythrin [Thioclava dalianensis]|uniref:Hemerythrin n=1 Tax=Thioclava dalianensis TaxID=1185766 RepID=A0A074TMC7_9RHOB|nr:hemerythrin domain-containing protein [Thioclava dalianensis]KEP70143.1 hemerythrin [Thioclava dalianensis]SFM80307.1 Hemerythrin HHE cation binding domain-containing protein [Thioclava dalianensis]